MSFAIGPVASAQNSASPSQQFFTIEKEASFPSEKDTVLLGQPAQIDYCDKSLVVSDFAAPALAIYSVDGYLQEWRSSPGQGPEEFALISKLDCEGKRIYLVDDGNSRIQIYGMNLEHIDSFRIPAMAAGDIVVVNDRVFVADLRQFGDGSLGAYSASGDPLNRFGGYVSMVPESIQRRVTKYRLREHDGRIFALSLHYPEIRVFDLAVGDERTLRLTGNEDDYMERTKQNYDWSQLTKDPRVVPTRYLFRSFVVTSDRILVGLYDTESLLIDEYTREGRFLKRHRSRSFNEIEGFYLYDLVVIEQLETGVRLALLSKNPLPQVSIVLLKLQISP